MPFRQCRPESLGLRPAWGIAPNRKAYFTAGQSHRLTSGGKTGADVEQISRVTLAGCAE
jgi:hypothetical protein